MHFTVFMIMISGPVKLWKKCQLLLSEKMKGMK